MGEPLLEARDLKTYFNTEDGLVRAVDGVSFSVDKGETLGIVGESGCGKSVTALSVMGLIPRPPGMIHGEIIFKGQSLLKKSETELRHVRGNEISMIFQEPMTSLNPLFSIGFQISEAITRHQKVSKAAGRRKTIEMLKLVGIPSAEKRIDDFPHQMSGGMRQRVMIAMALSCNPELLIADEPTTALDVTIQAQILDLMQKLQERLGTAIIFITHDLGVIAEIADKVVVMYAGEIVESADVNTLFKDARHPYTLGLLGSIPKINEDRDRLQVIEGVVPSAYGFPAGCRFHPRCCSAGKNCNKEVPKLLHVGDGHEVRCFSLLDSADGGITQGGEHRIRDTHRS